MMINKYIKFILIFFSFLLTIITVVFTYNIVVPDNYISEIVNVSINNNISAIILTNTTEGNRDNLVSKMNKEEGGLSGEPLQKISTNIIKKFQVSFFMFMFFQLTSVGYPLYPPEKRFRLDQ